MTDLLFFAICFVALGVILLVRLICGPTMADRALASDCVEIVTDMALILFSLWTGRGVYLDIALVTAVLGFIGTTLIGRYLGGEL